MGAILGGVSEQVNEAKSMTAQHLAVVIQGFRIISRTDTTSLVKVGGEGRRQTGDVVRLVTLAIVPGSRRTRKQSTCPINALTGHVKSPPNASEVPLLEIASSRHTLLTEECGSLITEH